MSEPRGWTLSEHARKRMAQHGLTEDDVVLILDHGVNVGPGRNGSCRYKLRGELLHGNPLLKHLADVQVFADPVSAFIVTVFPHERSDRQRRHEWHKRRKYVR